MRNFKMKRTKPIFVSRAAFVNVVLLASVAIFVSVAVLTGKFVSDNILPDREQNGDKVTVTDPTDTSFDTPTPIPTPSGTPSGSLADENDDLVSKSVKIESRDYYFVQFGVFDSIQNANVCAESIEKLGGAGYIHNSDGKYYVFAMCYTRGNDAKQVVANLKQDGYSTLLKCFSQRSISLNIKGSKENVNSIESAYSYFSVSAEDIEELIYKFDKGEIDRTELKNGLRDMLTKIKEKSDVFKLFENQNKIFADAKTSLDSFYNDISALLKLDDDMKIKSGIKKTYITSVFNFIEYLDNALVG